MASMQASAAISLLLAALHAQDTAEMAGLARLKRHISYVCVWKLCSSVVASLTACARAAKSNPLAVTDHVEVAAVGTQESERA